MNPQEQCYNKVFGPPVGPKKSTFTSLIMQCDSLLPAAFKRDLVHNNMLPRGFKICSTYASVHEEFQSVKQLLSRNKFTSAFIDRLIATFWVSVCS